jgi:hypothetical protein
MGQDEVDGVMEGWSDGESRKQKLRKQKPTPGGVEGVMEWWGSM